MPARRRTTKDATGRQGLSTETQERLGEIERVLRRVADGEDAQEELAAAVDGAFRSAAAQALDTPFDPYTPATDIGSVVADNLRSLRNESGWTQAQVAEAMTSRGFDWKRVTVAEIEGAVRRVSLEELVVIASLHAVPMFSLLLPTEQAVVEISEPIDVHSDELSELMLGRGGRLGTGGSAWRVAARIAGTPKGKADVRPAVARRRRPGEEGRSKGR
jgi:transcriptional regulator with XRE-family HTH domain